MPWLIKQEGSCFHQERGSPAIWYSAKPNQQQKVVVVVVDCCVRRYYIQTSRLFAHIAHVCMYMHILLLYLRIHILYVYIYIYIYIYIMYTCFVHTSTHIFEASQIRNGPSPRRNQAQYRSKLETLFKAADVTNDGYLELATWMQSEFKIFKKLKRCWVNTVDGRNPAPPDMYETL